MNAKRDSITAAVMSCGLAAFLLLVNLAMALTA